MSIQDFSFPLPENRCFKAGGYIYKFKLRGGSGCSEEEVMEGNRFNQELEEIIRTVIKNPDSLQPFSSAHFKVFPYKKRWEGRSQVICKHWRRNLRAYPFIFILYLERNTQSGTQEEKKKLNQEEVEKTLCAAEPQPKRYKSDSPLEDAVLKALMKDLEADSRVAVRRELYTGGSKEGEARRADKKWTKQETAVKGGSGSPADVHPGTVGEEEEEEEGEDSEPPVKPGILTQLARHVFPFSLLFRGS